ncbi:hypothetical protein N8464_00330 [bacterium]|nr:hypothetical protein [bacterium]|tara:strand:- start:151 stop:483 length:333 start_codon:yes stop_codon:yes gene_type:complete
MASNFKTATQANVGTSLSSIYTCPSNTTSTIIGMYLCNQSGGSIEATVEFYDASTSTHVGIVSNTPIPSGTSIAVIGGDAKVVLEAADAIKVQSNVVNSIDVVLSYLEQT